MKESQILEDGKGKKSPLTECRQNVLQGLIEPSI